MLCRGVVGDSTGLKVFVGLLCAICTDVLFRGCVVCGIGYNQWNAKSITLLSHIELSVALLSCNYRVIVL